MTTSETYQNDLFPGEKTRLAYDRTLVAVGYQTDADRTSNPPGTYPLVPARPDSA